MTTKIVKDTERTPKYPRGWHRVERVIWPDGDRSVYKTNVTRNARGKG